MGALPTPFGRGAVAVTTAEAVRGLGIVVTHRGRENPAATVDACNVINVNHRNRRRDPRDRPRCGALIIRWQRLRSSDVTMRLLCSIITFVVRRLALVVRRL